MVVLCLNMTFCHNMYYGIVYKHVGLLDGFLVDWVVLSFNQIIVRSNLVLVIVVGVCDMFRWRG